MKSVITFISIGILLFTLVGCGESDPIIEGEEPTSLIERNSEEKISTDNKTEDLTSKEGKDEIEQSNLVQKNNILEKEMEKPEDKGLESVQQDNFINEETPQKRSKAQPEKQEAEVIAKSNNTVTSMEKEEILNEIDKLLDDVFKDIDEIDSIEDDDLVVGD